MEIGPEWRLRRMSVKYRMKNAIEGMTDQNQTEKNSTSSVVKVEGRPCGFSLL